MFDHLQGPWKAWKEYTVWLTFQWGGRSTRGIGQAELLFFTRNRLYSPRKLILTVNFTFNSFICLKCLNYLVAYFALEIYSLGTKNKNSLSCVFTLSLRCLNTVCARFTICTADVNKRAHKALRKTNMEPVQWSFYFVHWNCASVFSGIIIKQFVMCEKRLLFNVLKLILFNTFGKSLVFPGLFVGIEKDREPCQMQRMLS